jgi:hypothetical protein
MCWFADSNTKAIRCQTDRGCHFGLQAGLRERGPTKSAKMRSGTELPISKLDEMRGKTAVLHLLYRLAGGALGILELALAIALFAEIPAIE